MRKIAAIIAVVGLATSPTLLAQSDPAMDKLAQQYAAAYNKADAKAVAAFYTSDAILLAPDGQLYTGRAAIEKQVSQMLAGPGKGAKLTLRNNRFQTIKPDVAISEGTFEITGTATPVKGRYVNTLVREGGEWRLASVVTVPDMSAMGAGMKK